MAEAFDELLTNPLKVVEDCKLIRTAMKRNWPIPADKRLALIERLFLLAMTSERPTDSIQAAKTVISADAINAKREGTRAAAKAAREASRPSVVNNTLNVLVSGIPDDQLAALYALRKRLAGPGDGAGGDAGGSPLPEPAP